MAVETYADAVKSPLDYTTAHEADSFGLKNLTGIDTFLIKASLAFGSIIDEIIGWWLRSRANCSFQRVYKHGRRSLSLKTNSCVRMCTKCKRSFLSFFHYLKCDGFDQSRPLHFRVL